MQIDQPASFVAEVEAIHAARIMMRPAMATDATTPNFHGLRLLSFESRRAKEMAALISSYGGQPLVVPALREVPLDSNAEALAFAGALLRGEFDIVIFLTGVGTRQLVNAIGKTCSRDEITAALARTKVIARGPKPLAVLRELEVPVWVTVPEPNTWRELLAAVDARVQERPLRGARVAVQEYGVSNTDLLDGLRTRGALVTRVPVYRWMLPEDVAPLKDAVMKVIAADVDVVVFTTSVQVVHLWQVARDLGLETDVRRGLERMVIGSIGPSTSEELGRHGLAADLEPTHPKMGFLVRELAERSGSLLAAKKADPTDQGPQPLSHQR
jgi:uroporphyrinogen-III synthase